MKCVGDNTSELKIQSLTRKKHKRRARPRVYKIKHRKIATEIETRGNLRISIPIFQDDYTFVAKNAIKKSALCEYFTYQSLVQDI